METPLPFGCTMTGFRSTSSILPTLTDQVRHAADDINQRVNIQLGPSPGSLEYGKRLELL